MYIQRALEKKISEADSYSPVVMVCGPEQAGKSMMLRHLMGPERTYVTLRDDRALELAKSDPRLFFETYRPPLLIDEFQLAPEILPTIQYLVDEKDLSGEDNSGMFWLAGSQKYTMMRSAGESLVGRCALFDMSSLSAAELDGVDAGVFDPDVDELRKREKLFGRKTSDDVLKRIWFGSMPRICARDSTPREDYYADYRDLYLMRDALEFSPIEKTGTFKKFIAYLAACTGQELNYASISKGIGISEPTVKNWVAMLETLGIVCVIQPYYNNRIKRLVKTPKLYFMDTGLVSYLCDIESPDAMLRSDMAGALFETYAVSEIVKSCYNSKKSLDLYYYRDADKREIDLLIQRGGKLYPIEIKMSHSPSGATKNLSVLDAYGTDVRPAVIICLTESMRPYGENAWLYPVSAL